MTTTQYVWGLGYVNTLVLRDDNSTSGSLGKTNSGLGRRLFVQQDANANVTSLVNTSGQVVERLLYDPYGKATAVDPTTWNPVTEQYNWVYTFQGGRQDPVSGLLHFMARDYSTTLGRWAQVDPIGSAGGSNLYQAEGGNPASWVDPLGLDPQKHDPFAGVDEIINDNPVYSHGYNAGQADGRRIWNNNMAALRAQAAAAARAAAQNVKNMARAYGDEAFGIPDPCPDSKAHEVARNISWTFAILGVVGEAGAIKKAAGQVHHAISKRVAKAIARNDNLAGKMARDTKGLTTRAKDLDSHNGYQSWHRALDEEIEKMVQDHPEWQPQDFIEWLIDRYGKPDLTPRFPNGLGS